MSRLRRIIIVLMFLLSIYITTAQESSSEFDVQGHRGARGLYPENTLPAFETALDLGVNTLEFDLHFTADNVVVVWHDESIEYDKCRLPEGVTEASLGIDNTINPRYISNLSLEQVQAFICDLNPDLNRFPTQLSSETALAGNDYRIQTVDAVFSFTQDYANSDDKTETQRDNANHVLFNIETKRQVNNPSTIGDDFDGENAGEFELAILDSVYEHELLDRVIIQSFDHRSIWAIKAEEPDITIAALTNRGSIRLESYVEQGVEIWSPNYTRLTQSLLDEAHDLGLRVIPWTVNDAETMQELIEMGVDGIITDYPDILIELLSESE